MKPIAYHGCSLMAICRPLICALGLLVTGCQPATETVSQLPEEPPMTSSPITDDMPADDARPADGRVRFATYNLALNRPTAGALVEELEGGTCNAARQLAKVIQKVRPDVLLVNELDFDEQHRAVSLFHDLYLNDPASESPIEYGYKFTASVNTGVASGLDLDNDGNVGGGADCFGFGRFPGQYGMAIYSRYPIDASSVRTFQMFLWADMPASTLTALMEEDAFYTAEEAAALRLSSKSHWDVPIDIHGHTIHFLVCHPTPPVFDGDEDRNGRRNHDEIRFLADYIMPARSDYIYDDLQNTGGLPPNASFVIAGDLNADPMDGESRDSAIRMLLDSERINSTFVPLSEGGQEAAAQGGANSSHRGDPAADTGDFSDEQPGNLRIDYVLPSADLLVADGGVFWPPKRSSDHEWTNASDHRLVWLDVVPSTD